MPLTHRGFTAWIVCDDEIVKEYQTEEVGLEKTCWIPSAAGKNFTVVWEDNEGDKASSGHIFIDGKDVASAIMRPGRGKPVERSGAKINARKIKPFEFSHIDLTDDTLANKHDPAVRNIGDIAIKITYVQLGARVPLRPNDEAENFGLIHEKAKKAGAHVTRFGDAQLATPSRAVSNKPLDPRNPGPHVTFTFKYRSMAVLQAEGRTRERNLKRFSSPIDESEVIEISDDEGKDKDSSQTLGEDDERPPPAKKHKPSSSPEPANAGFFASGDGRDASPTSSATQDEQPLFLEDDEEGEGAHDAPGTSMTVSQMEAQTREDDMDEDM